MDALHEAKKSLDSFEHEFTDAGKVYALDAICYALIAIAEELQKMNERAERDWFAENEKEGMSIEEMDRINEHEMWGPEGRP